MTIPMHKIKKFLNENKKINLKIKKNLKLNFKFSFLKLRLELK